MKLIEFTLETLSPVAFAEKNNDSTLYVTKKYITGTAIRGYLAQRFINYKRLGNDAHKDADFYDIFLSGKVKFLPAYPIGNNPDNVQYEPFIIPPSMMRHKSTGKIIDLSKDDSNIEVGYKKFSGFALKKDSVIYKVEPKTQIQLHMARTKNDSRITGSSKDGDIFNYEYIEPHQYFKGLFVVNDDLLMQKLHKFLSKTVNIMRIGRSKQVQYGKCAFKLHNTRECSPVKINTDKSFYLYTYTPYIPFTQWQRTDRIAEELLTILEKRLQTKYPTVKICKDTLKIFANNEEISGYMNVWHMRRERKIALSTASLIQFKAENMTNDSISFLNELLYHGLGWRTPEGFGQFRLWQTGDSIEMKDMEKTRLQRPAQLDLVKSKACAVIQQRILIEIKKVAKDTADDAKISDSKKHILNRVEELMDSTLTKNEIQAKITAFKKKANENLHNIYIKRDDLSDILLEENNTTSPYASIKWENRLGLKENQIQDLKTDLGKDVFFVDENTLYKHFWLWFARHAKKNM